MLDNRFSWNADDVTITHPHPLSKSKPTRRLAPIPFDTPKNHRAIATYTRVLSSAFHTLGRSIADQLRTRAVGKAFNPDQPRDEHGRWEGGGGDWKDQVVTKESVHNLLRDMYANGTPVERAALNQVKDVQIGTASNIPGSAHQNQAMAINVSTGTLHVNDKGQFGSAVDAQGNTVDTSKERLTSTSVSEIKHELGHLVYEQVKGTPAGKAFARQVATDAKSGKAISRYQATMYERYNAGKVTLDRVAHESYAEWMRFGLKNDRGATQQHAAAQKLSDVVVRQLTKFEKADKTPEEQLAEAQAIVDALDLSTLEVIVEELTNAGIDVATDAGILAISQFGMESNSNLVDHVNTRAVDWAKDRAAELVGMHYDAAGNLVPSANAAMRIDESTRDMVRDSIAAGLQNGDRITEIADDLADLYAFSDERAALIANTEVRRAQSQGALDGYKETQKLGVEMYKIWLVADEPCEICEPNGEQGAIPIDDDFDSGDDAPPAHPNCRCVIAPVVDENAFDSETEDS